MRILTKHLKDLEEQSNTLETSIQAMSDIYDHCKSEYETSSDQISDFNKKLNILRKNLSKA